MAIYRYNFIAKIIKNPEKSTEHRNILDICQAPTCSMASSVKGCQYRIPTYTLAGTSFSHNAFFSASACTIQKSPPNESSWWESNQLFRKLLIPIK